LNVAVVGAGSWGTALSILLARNGHEVVLLGRNETELEAIRESGENHHYLPGFPIPSSVKVARIDHDLDSTDMTVVAVPSAAVREIAREIRGRHPLVVVAAKGLEAGSAKLMTEVVAEEQPDAVVGVLSGPNLAVEIARGVPTVAIAAFSAPDAAATTQKAFGCRTFRVSISDDVVGVELAGALKNVLAIGGGMSDGLGFGDNTKGAFLSRGLVEMARLGLAMGGRMDTFLGPAGVGDLFATAASRLSRNYRFGHALGSGRGAEQTLAAIGQVVEGIASSEAAILLAARHQVEVPVMAAITAVMRGLLSPQQAVGRLMDRALRTSDFLS